MIEQIESKLFDWTKTNQLIITHRHTHTHRKLRLIFAFRILFHVLSFFGRIKVHK